MQCQRDMVNSIRYCNEDEDNDPNEEFEEILLCVECADMGKWLTLQNIQPCTFRRR